MSDYQLPVIQAARLTKTFRDFWLRVRVAAVSELDLVVQPHEVFGLLGPNGSGKSTTIKMILGLLFPTSGRIAIFGRRPTDVAVKSRIGFLPEESYLYPFLDARETLDYYGRLFHQPRRERMRRTDMLLDMVGLASVAYRRVGEYSKGMQRRIGLAQALINDPDLLILDEPTSGMDPVGTRQFKDLIATLAARGKTILLSSHLLADVEDVCHRVSILYGGRQRADGELGELLACREQMQLTTSRLSDATLARIRELIAADGAELLDVAAPRDRLENLFLRIVRQAQEQRVATGGATLGGGVAEFLRAPQQPGQVLDELVAAGQPKAAAAAAPATPRPAAADVLNELVSDGKAATPPATPATPKPARNASQPADGGVLDELLGGGSDQGGR